ncbi:UNVERIFIED_CONTAM: hypothetical protein HDU68_005540 [Siphonaria sp. JEL0065]|nr:hypothetical protein HDU68_005540 [Siphonaria sp. JEL0065]
MKFTQVLSLAVVPLAVQALPLPGGPQVAIGATTAAVQILTSILGNIPAIVKLITGIINPTVKPAGFLSTASATSSFFNSGAQTNALTVIQAVLDAVNATSQAGGDANKAIAGVMHVLAQPGVLQSGEQLSQTLTQVTGSVTGYTSVFMNADVAANLFGVLSNPDTIANLGKIFSNVYYDASAATTHDQAVSNVLDVFSMPSNMKLLQDIYIATVSVPGDDLTPQPGLEAVL